MSEKNQNPAGDIFSLDTSSYNDAVTTSSDVKGNPEYYKPSLDNPNVKDNIYDSLIRFLPNALNPNLLVVSKYGYYFSETPNGSAAWIDCTSNDPQGNQPNIITQAFFFLRNHDSVALKNLARNFSRKQYFWMLVQVIKDSQQPDIEGQIKIMRFGKQVESLHDKELEDKTEYGKPPCVFYHPYLGKDFNLIINKKQVEFNGKLRTITNYDESSFMQVSPIKIDGNPIEETPEDRQKLVAWLRENSPDLSQESYVPWDADTEELAIGTVRTIIDDEVVFNKIWNLTYKGKRKLKSQPSGAGSSDTKQADVESVKSKITTDEAPAPKQDDNATADTGDGNGNITVDEIDFEDI